jgi:hypothetical protein
MWTQSYQKDLTSLEEAVRIGYEEGKGLRDNGALPKDLALNIEVHRGIIRVVHIMIAGSKGFARVS